MEIRGEARRGKAAIARLTGEAEGAPRLLQAGPDLAERLAAFVPDVVLELGSSARHRAEVAQEAVLETLYPLPGGGRIAVEPTRALTAIDVDLGDRPGVDSKRAARAANLAALSEAARLLRLKGLGGLIAIDLVGRGHDGAALLAAARNAFSADNPGVAIAPLSRFGVIELTIPRRERGALDILCDEGGAPTPLTRALNLVRALEREAAADGGGRFEALAPADVVQVAGAAIAALTAKVGARVQLRAEPGVDAQGLVRRV